MAVRPNPNKELQKLLDGAKQGRLPFERDAWLNLAFFLGQQYVEWSSDISNIREIPRRENEENTPRPVINKIMHFVRTAHHDAMQDEPSPDVLPPTGDYADISDAQVAKAWCDWKAGETQCDYTDRLSRATLWAIICGNGYKKWSWDKERGLQIGTPSFFELYLDPYARTFRDCRYIIHSQFMDCEQVYDAYGIEITNDAVETADETRTSLLRGMGAAPVLTGVTVNELWMKPSRRHPRGRYAVWAGNKQLVPPSDLPYEHLIKYRMLPFTVVGCIERPDSPYFLSPIQFLRPPQMELNKYHAQRLLIRERFANPKWWIDGALDLDNDPDDSPSQILRGASSVPGLKPELIQPTTYPPNDDGEMLEQGMMHLVGQHEVSQAQVPGRVEAAKAIELLKESDAGAQATLRKTTRSATSIGWYQSLELARQFGPEEEMVTAYSRDGVPEVKHFRAGEMKPGFRVRTSMTTGLARTRTSRQDLAIRLWDSKVISDPDQLLELMEVPTNSVANYRAVAIRLARNENLVMVKSEPVDPHSWDDHALHIREHNAFRMTHEFEVLDEEAKKIFEYHVQGHKRLQKEQVAEQAQLQMIAQGQPGAPAGPVPPGEGPSTTPPDQEATNG